MNTQVIQQNLRRQPFRPFVMRMNDGRKFRVTHPEWVTVSRRYVTVIDPQNDIPIYLEPVLIASLHFEEPVGDLPPGKPSPPNDGSLPE